MVGFRLAPGLMVVCMVIVQAAHAEMSGDDYRSPTVLSSPQERARVAEELEADRERMAREAERQQEAYAKWLEVERQREQQRPLGERLIDARCTSCHALDVVSAQRMSGLGWRWTVERMRWWHGAALGEGEASVITQHLAQTHGDASSSAWLVAGSGVAMAGFIFGMRRIRGRRAGVETARQQKGI